MKRLAIAGLALALISGLAAGSATAKKERVKVKTSLAIEDVTFAPGNVATFSGDVDALKRGCQRKREVEVRFLGSDMFPPNSYGTTRSDGSGHWELTTTEPLPIEGDYQATAERRKLNKKRKKIAACVSGIEALPGAKQRFRRRPAEFADDLELPAHPDATESDDQGERCN